MSANSSLSMVSIDKLVNALDCVRECEGLTPAEKEIIIRFAKDDDVAHVYTEYGSAVKRLLLHPEFTATELRICGSDCTHPPFGERIDPVAFDGGAITGVKGTIPIGCLSISQQSRSTAIRANVVSPSVLENDPRKDESSGGDSR